MNNIRYHVFKICPFCQSRDTLTEGQCSEVTCTTCNKTFDYTKVQRAISHNDLMKKVERVLKICPDIGQEKP